MGGKPLEAALACAKPFARFAMGGMIAGYNGEDTGPSNLTEIIRKRLLPHGFLVSDHLERQPACVEPVAFLKLSPGENFGKMLVKLSS